MKKFGNVFDCQQGYDNKSIRYDSKKVDELIKTYLSENIYDKNNDIYPDDGFSSKRKVARNWKEIY